MAIHMEVEYTKRFERSDAALGLDGGGKSSEGGDGNGNGDSSETPPPPPPKADVSWAHILAQNQVCFINRVSGQWRRNGTTLGWKALAAYTARTEMMILWCVCRVEICLAGVLYFC